MPIFELMKRIIILLTFGFLFFFVKNTKAQVTIDSIVVKFDSLAYDSLRVYYTSGLSKPNIIFSGLSNNPLTNCVFQTIDLSFIGNPDTNILKHDTSIRIGYFGYLTRKLEVLALWDTLPQSPFSLMLLLDSTGFDSCSVTSIIEHSDNFKLDIYPNPTNGLLHIKTNSNISINEIRVYNLNGRLIDSFIPNLNKIDISNYSKGVYFVEVISESRSLIKKIIFN